MINCQYYWINWSRCTTLFYFQWKVHSYLETVRNAEIAPQCPLVLSIIIRATPYVDGLVVRGYLNDVVKPELKVRN